MDSSDWMMALGALAGGLGGYYGSQKKADREDARLNKLLGITDPTTAAAAAATAPGVNEIVNPATGAADLAALAELNPTHPAIIKDLQESYWIGRDRRDVENPERFIYDEDGRVKGLKFKEGEGGKGLFDVFDQYYNPVHDAITVGDDPESFSNNLSDFLLGLEGAEYDAEGNLIKGDPNENWLNTSGVLPLLPLLAGGPLGIGAFGLGAGYQGLSSFAPEFTQKYVDPLPGRAWEGIKDIFTEPWFPGYSESYNTGGRVGYDNGGSIEDYYKPFGIDYGPPEDTPMDQLPEWARNMRQVDDLLIPDFINPIVGGIRDLLGMETSFEEMQRIKADPELAELYGLDLD